MVFTVPGIEFMPAGVLPIGCIVFVVTAGNVVVLLASSDNDNEVSLLIHTPVWYCITTSLSTGYRLPVQLCNQSASSYLIACMFVPTIDKKLPTHSLTHSLISLSLSRSLSLSCSEFPNGEAQVLQDKNNPIFAATGYSTVQLL